MKKGPISILVADDSSLWREALTSLLADTASIKIMGQANNGKEVLHLLESRKFDVILLDINMPILDGVDVSRHIKSFYPSVKVLILTQYDDHEYIIELLKNGAQGYLVKAYTNKKELVEAIKMVTNNNFYFNEYVSLALLQEVTKQKLVTPKFNPDVELKEIEIQILKLICQEKTSKEIGDELHLSKRTIEDRRQIMMQKIGVKSVVGLVIYAFRIGLG
ncbi:MAG: response regulator transcription factor [Bacteroidota bacterium]